jgi:hypothetical protein
VLNKIFLTFSGVILVLICNSRGIPEGEPDYPLIFGNNWHKAVGFIEENRDWMGKICLENGVDFNFVTAMVFPELVRYSALRDQVEITLLKALYVHYGTGYSDFSVGVFQIKPSCAESILKHLSRPINRDLVVRIRNIHDLPSVREKRKAILTELENPAGEYTMVVAMVQILEKKYNRIRWKNQDEKLRFFSTAYNSGFTLPEKTIREMIKMKLFHTKLGRPSVTYSYSDISSAWFRNFR